MDAKMKPNRGWKRIVLIIAGALALLCVLCVGGLYAIGTSPWAKESLARSNATTTVVAAVYMTRTAVALPTITLTETAIPTIAQAVTPTTGSSPAVTHTATHTLIPTRTPVPTRTTDPTRTSVPTKTTIPSKTPTSTKIPTPTIDPEAAGLPGLWPADVRVNVEDQFGLSCDGPDIQGDTVVWICIRDLGTAVLRVDVYSLGGIQVDIIDAKIAGFFDDETAAKFLGFIATMPYDGAEPASARLWVAENVAKPKAETVIGNVWFELSGDGSMRELVMSKP